jgi:hypothetical protein
VNDSPGAASGLVPETPVSLRMIARNFCPATHFGVPALGQSGQTPVAIQGIGIGLEVTGFPKLLKSNDMGAVN